MLSLTKYKQRLEDVADMADVPEDLCKRIYDSACEAEQRDLIDYSDGDFIFLITFNYSKHLWLHELKALLPNDVVMRDKFGISFYQ